ncbi:gamma-butyrobetaine hydroxylase-like domain-containing protein [Bradyrhizobium sp. CCBAU 21362]|uniref:gamma-butyrobetaine hydroxylase-like domain-containing protein n=1 Tax=Bradyrhizobium sp. CCBAU 21362 TaxID=1325082 RepID=UPI0023060F30|nr:gamma-butyrobetaine hydroxylase-like domain-containing protein [Bradyrhizobium sp. CCBAU 21362]
MNVQPIQVELGDNSTALALTWSDCGTLVLGAETLRRASRAASEIRRQVDGIELMIARGFHVAGFEPIGNYALRLLFSDGHDRGIYPWSYLRELAEQQPA